MRSLLLLAALGGSLVSAQAQSVFVPDNNASTGGANVIPFGNTKTSTTWANQVYQCLIPASFSNNQPTLVRDLGFAPGSTNAHNFDRITIKMGVFKGTTLNATFASNFDSTPTTVLDEKDYTWHITTNQWTRIGLSKPFLWIPQLGNLVVEITTQGSGGVGSASTSGFRRSSTIERKYAVGWSGTPPTTGNTGQSLAAAKIELVVTAADASIFGMGCMGSGGTPSFSYSGPPVLGNTIKMSVSNGPSNGAAAIFMGLTARGPTFPVDLTPFGGTGCNLYCSPDFPAGLGLVGGTGSLNLSVPKDSGLIGIVLWHQAVVVDPKANSLGLTLSDYGRLLLGN